MHAGDLDHAGQQYVAGESTGEEEALGHAC